MFNNFKLNIARRILASFLVDIRKNPEKVTKHETGSITVNQNLQIAKAFEAIDNLKKEVNK